MSTQTQADAGANDNATDDSASQANIKQFMVDASTQTEENMFADSGPMDNRAPEATLVNTPTEVVSPSMIYHGYDEDSIKPKDDIVKVTSFSMETIALVNRALNQVVFQRVQKELAPTNGLGNIEQEETRNTDFLPGAMDSGHHTPLEEIDSTIPDASENIAATLASLTAQEQLLRAEEAAHQQTREELARLEIWCESLEYENSGLRTRVDHAERENAGLQIQVQDAEDQRRGLFMEISDAERRATDLLNSNELYISMITDLRNRVLDLEANISGYIQLGIHFFARLQKAEKLLNPCDRVFAEFKRLLSDAAQYFNPPVGAGERNGDFHDDVARVEEIDEDDHEEEGHNDQEDDTTLELLTNVISSSHPSTKNAAASPAEDSDTPPDDEAVPGPSRPMRPGTAKRTPLSAFAAKFENSSENPSLSRFENSAQQSLQAPSTATSAISIDFGFSEASAKSEEEESEMDALPEVVQESKYTPKVSKTSARKRDRRGGNDGRGSQGRGTKGALRGGRVTPWGN